MILAVEKSELSVILDQLTEKLRYLPHENLKLFIKNAIENVKFAIEWMNQYENYLKFQAKNDENSPGKKLVF